MKLSALPFAKFELERCGEDSQSHGAVSDLALSRGARLKDAIYQESHLANPTAELKFGSFTATLVSLHN